jgi:hypothetical protein
MPKLEDNENLAVEPLGNLLEIQVTGLEPEQWVNLLSNGWRTDPPRLVTVACTLSVDDAMDLRGQINAWLRSLGEEG